MGTNWLNKYDDFVARVGKNLVSIEARKVVRLNREVDWSIVPAVGGVEYLWVKKIVWEIFNWVAEGKGGLGLVVRCYKGVSGREINDWTEDQLRDHISMLTFVISARQS